MKRIAKIFLLILADIFIVALSIITACFMKYGINIRGEISFEVLIITFLGLSIVVLISNSLLDCYERSWRYASITEIMRLGISSFLSVLMFGAFSFVLETIKGNILPNIDLSFLILVMMSLFVLMSLVRFSIRIQNQIAVYFNRFKAYENGSIIIYATSAECRFVAESIMVNGEYDIRSINLVLDADSNMMVRSICNFPIIGYGVEDLKNAIIKTDAVKVIIKKADIERDKLFEILKLCTDNDCILQTISNLEDFTEESSAPNFHNLKIEDLLGREPSVMEDEIAKNYISKKIVLVTGGAGSIGSEICRQVLKYKCAKLFVLDIHENGLFYLDQELKAIYPEEKFKMLVGSVRDERRLEEIFSTYRPDIVFHAAAHKHVPMMEINPIEAIKNNVFGTLKVCEKAKEYGVSKFVLISTDKAVNPTNVMGTTKRIAEMIIQDMNGKSDRTDFVAVRFGNVLGSNGSVIPTFKEQIEKGGPVTVTHPEIQRYFMTIPEAVSLVLQTGSIANGGEIFVLDMGKPMRIVELAENMIRLAGLRPYKDISIDFTGLRPGEKMFEELNFDDEKLGRTNNEKIFILKIHKTCDDFDRKLENLNKIGKESNSNSCIAALKDIVDEYTPSVSLQKTMPITIDDDN